MSNKGLAFYQIARPLAELLGKNPDGFNHVVRDNARHLLSGFTEDEIVKIFARRGVGRGR